MSMNSSVKSVRILLALFVFAALGFALQAAAATRTWSGAGGDANWSTAANWGGTAPVAGDDLVFPGGAAQLTNSNDFAASTSFNTISFTGASGGYVLGGNAIQLVAGITASNTTGNNSVALPITLGASQTFSCSTPVASGRLFVAGTIALGTFTLTFSPSSGSFIEVQNPAVISGTGGITAAGAGIVALESNCTYSGPTTVTGYLSLNADTLNPASAVTVNGELQLSNGASIGSMTVAASGVVGLFGGGVTNAGSVTSMSMASGSRMALGMNFATRYGQLNSSGGVDITGVTLQLDWSFTSSSGNTFTIINKTGAGAVTGTFSGLAEGATFTSNGRTYAITYVGGDGNDVVLTDVTPLPPVLTKSFGSGIINPNATTSLTFVATNPNFATGLTGVGFTDTLPAGLVVATPNGLSSTCGGSTAATAGSGTISLSGGSIGASGSCTIVVNVTSTAVGSFVNTTSTVASTEGGPGAPASATIEVAEPIPTLGGWGLLALAALLGAAALLVLRRWSF